MTTDSNESVQLTRIEGGINLLNERLGAVRDDIRDMRDVQQTHARQISDLEKDRNVRDGERKGIAFGGRTLCVIIGILISAIGAGLLRHFGV